MYYLERNRQVVAELGRLWTPQIGDRVGSSSRMDFHSVGSYHSPSQGREVFVGLKEYQKPIDRGLFVWRAPEELATIAAIAEHRPRLRDSLPLFYALLRGAKDHRRGLLMEDFTRGGRLPIHGTHDVPQEIIDLFGEDVLEEDFTCNMAFNVGGRIRYGDFHPFFQTFKKKVAMARFPMDQALRQVTRNMAHHTVRLGRDL